MIAGSVLLSIGAALVTLMASLFAGHPLVVALLSYSLAGSMTLLALALTLHWSDAPQT